MSGEYPPDWSTPELGDFAKATGGSGFPPSAQGSTEGDYPFYKVSDMNLPGNERFMGDANHWITEETRKRIKARTFPVGTVIFPKIGAAVATNKKRLLTRESIIDNNVMAVVVDDPKRCAFSYLRFWFETIDLRDLSNSGALPSIPGHRVHTIRVPLPPLPEQKKIAHILSTVQRAIEAQERIIQTTTELKKALMNKLFTEGLRHEPQKQTEIGPVPESWDVVPLATLIRSTLQNGAFVQKPQTGKGFLFANVVDMYRETHLNLSSLERLDVPADSISQYWLRDGDILVVRSSLKREGIGQNCVARNLSESVFYDCHLIRIQTDPRKLIPEFLSMFWRSDIGKNDLVLRSKTTTMTTINQQGISKALVPVAPIDEQSEIVELLETIDTKIRRHRAQKQQLEDLFRTLLHELMTAKTPVKHLNIHPDSIS
jgi:type I restriction enzyme S subunit